MRQFKAGDTASQAAYIRAGGCGDMYPQRFRDFAADHLSKPAENDTPHGTRNGEPDSCGGYALNHRWL